jgi:hypothetical protein
LAKIISHNVTNFSCSVLAPNDLKAIETRSDVGPKTSFTSGFSIGFSLGKFG